MYHFFIPAINISFGSLYSDEVLISPVKAISVLACATLLGLVRKLCVTVIMWYCLTFLLELR